MLEHDRQICMFPVRSTLQLVFLYMVDMSRFFNRFWRVFWQDFWHQIRIRGPEDEILSLTVLLGQRKSPLDSVNRQTGHTLPEPWVGKALQSLGFKFLVPSASRNMCWDGEIQVYSTTGTERTTRNMYVKVPCIEHVM